MIPLALISAGVGLAGNLFGKKHKRPHINVPSADLTAGDYGFAETQRNRSMEIAQARAKAGRSAAVNRFAAMPGGGFSPLLERTNTRIDQQLAGSQVEGNRATSDLLYGLKGRREARNWEAQKLNFGSDVADFDQQNERRAGFWNSLGDVASLAVNHFGGGGGGAGGGSNWMSTGSYEGYRDFAPTRGGGGWDAAVEGVS